MEHWLKEQLNEAHKLLDGMGVLDRETRPVDTWRPKRQGQALAA